MLTSTRECALLASSHVCGARAVYNRALSTAELQTLYAEQKFQPFVSSATDITFGRVGLWRFNSCPSSSALADESDSGTAYSLTIAAGGCGAGNNGAATAGRGGSGAYYMPGGAGEKGGPQVSGTIPGLTSGGSARFTLVAWVKSLSNQCSGCSGAGIFGMGNTGLEKHFYLRQHIHAGRYSMGSDDNGNDMWHALGPAPVNNQWVHIAAAWTGRAIYLWINGAQYTTIGTNLKITPPNTFTLGSDGHNDNPFNGFFDNVMIYDRPLVQQEIAVLAGQTD